MQTSGWIQLALFVVALAAITKPMGLYLVQVLDSNGRTWFDPVLRPLERLTYKLMAGGRNGGRRFYFARVRRHAQHFGAKIFTLPKSFPQLTGASSRKRIHP